MIRSFRCRDTEALFNDHDVSRFRAFERIARRKLLYLHRARRLDDLRVPPGNRLEALKGTGKANTVSASMISIGSVLVGKKVMSMM